jgi:hypothetical protein
MVVVMMKNQRRSISHSFLILSAFAFFSTIPDAVAQAQATTFKTANSADVIEAENLRCSEKSAVGQSRSETRETGYPGYGVTDCRYALYGNHRQDAGIYSDNSCASFNINGVGTVSTVRNIYSTGKSGPVNDEDDDAVDDEEEDGVANNGDGNSDGVADRLQSHVTSMRSLSGEYVTLVAPAGSRLVDCRVLDWPPTDTSIPDVVFSQGFFEFSISDLENPDGVTLEIILHSSEVPVNYYKYGPTPDDTTDHWYEFLFNGETGAEMHGNAITLHFIDAKRGDDVLEADDMIVGTGGPAYLDDNAGTGQDMLPCCFIASMFY